MKVLVGYKTNLLLSSLRSRGLINTAVRLVRKQLYAGNGLPTYIQIEISNRCNLSCKYCAASRDLMKGSGRDMSLAEFKKIINDILARKNYFPTIQLAFRGEPFMNRDACSMIKYATDRGLFVVINTNGILMNKSLNKGLILSRLNQLIISVDSINKETYESVRIGGKFEVLINNIKDLVRQKKECRSRLPFIELQYIVTKNTEDEIDDFMKLSKSLGVDNMRFKTYKVTCLGRGSDSVQTLKDLLPKRNEYSRYSLKKGKLELKNKPIGCSWSCDCLIYSDGDMGACCEDYNKEYVVGNALNSNFWNVWNGEKSLSLRNNIKKRNLDICKTCS